MSSETPKGYWCIRCEKVHPFSNKRHLCYVPLYGTPIYTKKNGAWIVNTNSRHGFGGAFEDKSPKGSGSGKK